MTQFALNTSSKKAPGHFDRADWAGAYCNVEHEFNDFPLEVSKGKVPKDLTGTLYRNGPGRLERSGQWVHHPFDGDGMIASFNFSNGKVIFRNRFIRTKAWEEEEKANRFLYRGVFGTQRAGGAIANAFDLRLKNIANTNVIKLGNQLLALWEAAEPHALDPETLETFGLSNLNGVLDPGEAFSAHPKFDPGHHGNPCLVTFGVKTGVKSTIRLMEFATDGPNSGDLIHDRKESLPGFAFLHDFAITPNWAIFLQNAISFNPLPFILGQKGAAQCLSSQKQGKAKFWLIPRQQGIFSGQSPKTIEASDGFVFHHLNAWEKEEEIIVESIYYKDFPSIKPNENFKDIDFDSIPEGVLKRCHINLSNNTSSTTTLSDQCCEFAMVNPRLQGLSARHSWMATSTREKGNAPLQAIKKLDLFNGKTCIWSAAPRGFVSEPLMVPKTNSTSEDEGWVFVLVWNAARSGTDLVILQANDLSEEAVLELPTPIPHGLHGSWFPQQ